MNKINDYFHKLLRKFMNTKISFKVMLGYICIVIIPTTLFSIVFQQQNHRALMQNYLDMEQHSLDLNCQNVNSKLHQICSVSDYFNSNLSVTNYLSKDYTTSESIYAYIKDLKGLYTYAVNVNDYVNNIIVYSNSNQVLTINNRLQNMANLSLDAKTIQQIQDTFNGIWIFEITDTNELLINYYSTIYSKNYDKKLGIIKIQVDSNLFSDSFSSVSQFVYKSDNFNFIYDRGVYETYNNSLSSGKNLVALDSSVQILNGSIIHIINPNKEFSYFNIKLIGIFILCFLILSFLYYFLFSAFTLRLLKLSSHMKGSHPDNLQHYRESSYQDEIGVLILSYNSMVDKINDLIHSVFVFELQKKDAEFYALYAQIQPHFLFNILENIHMSAEKHNDEETSTMIERLGKFMRYNLNKKPTPVEFLQELEHTRDYLDFYKYRMGDLLDIQIASFTEIEAVKCPCFTLQPIIENIFTHAQKNKTYLKISIFIKDGSIYNRSGDIVVEIKDNGYGMTKIELADLQTKLQQSDYESNKHIGLNNVNQRLLYFYGPEYGIKVSSKRNKGTVVTIFMKKTYSSSFEDA